MCDGGAVLVEGKEVRLASAGAMPLGSASYTVVGRSINVLRPGEILVEVRYASLDPYQRLRIRTSDAGVVPPAGVVGRVAASASPIIDVGEWVTAEADWSTHCVVRDCNAVVVTPDEAVPLYHWVGLLGLTGLTAYFGVREVARPSPGDRLVVTGASGGVGQVACQVAVDLGADVVGLVSSSRKAESLGKLGVRAVDRSDPGWLATIDAWAPDGVDLLFDNVWGDTAARVVERLKPLGRVALCGQMSGYRGDRVPPLPIDDWFRLVTRSLTVQGFRAVDFTPHFATARQVLFDMVKSGRLDQEVQIVRGWEEAGQAMVDLMDGRTTGKVIVDSMVKQ